MAKIAERLVWVRMRVQAIRTVLKRAPIIPTTVVVAVVFVAFFADFLAPHSPYDASLPDKLKPPFWAEGGSTEFVLGTDQLGRDILSRIVFGARISLMVMLAALALAGSVGLALGLIAGFYGRWRDALIMRFCDAIFAFPSILLALLFSIVLGPSFATVVVILAIIFWARYARLVRGEVLSWKQRDFVAYARVAGTSAARIMLQHLLPNVLNSFIVLLTFQAGAVIILEASLSFLGAGVPPPTPSWGGMVAGGREYVTSAWWVSLFPGLAIIVTCLSLNLLGDWLRDYLDPKLRQV